jgi:GT2 family glycosyltransferase
MPRVATVILNWNGMADTLECLASVCASEHQGWEHAIVVADNGSTDGSAAAVAKHFPEVVVLDNGGNLGFAEGNNRAIEWARAAGMDYVILLNNDTVVMKDTLQLLVEFAERRERVGAVMPLIKYYASDEVWYAGGAWISPYGRMEPLAAPTSTAPYRTQLFTACCVLIPMQVLNEVGAFDPELFMYFEDTDLALRVEEARYETWVVPAAVTLHKVSRSTGGALSALSVYYQTRNNLVLIRHRMKHGTTRGIGYLYMVALSAKMYLNLLSRPIPRKRAVARAILDAWGDFFRGRLGARLQESR